MINFPGLGLNFNVPQIAIKIFGVNIYWYAICIVLGIVVALIICSESKEKFNVKFDFLFECIMYAILCGIFGARLYYVLFNLDYYLENPTNILKIRNGGLAIYGGLIIGVIVIIIKCKKNKVNVLDFLDYFAPFVALAQSIGRWGNFFNQEAYGTETANIFRMGIHTENGYQEVHPTFLYESISTLIIFLILRKMQKNRKFKGQICYSYLVLYSGIRMIIESIRIDSLMWGNFRISQVLSIAIFVIFGIMLLKKYIKYNKIEKIRFKKEKKV